MQKPESLLNEIFKAWVLFSQAFEENGIYFKLYFYTHFAKSINSLKRKPWSHEMVINAADRSFHITTGSLQEGSPFLFKR